MDKKLYLFMLAILLVVSLMMPAFAWGQTESAQQFFLQELDDLSKAVLALTEQGKYAEAKGKLDELAQRFTQVAFKKNISIEALELASNTLVQGKRAFTPVSPDKREMLWHATQIRIMIDALTHSHRPIWKEYFSTYLEQVSKMIHLAERQQENDLKKALQENMKLYNILKPAFALNHSPSTMEMLDSLYRFLFQQTHQSKIEWQAIQEPLKQLKDLTEQIFSGKDRPTFAWYISSNSPITMIGLMSLILLTALSYAGWRMYQGQRFT